jgi:HAD superfamily hydrolase (TIGR01509 family)
VVFDLDGTLVDSYGAIAESINHARCAFDLPALSHDAVRRGVGRGLESLIEELVGGDRIEAGVRLFRERYAEVYASGTVPLAGAREVVGELARRGFRLSIASNKPARFSEAIVRALDLGAFDVVQGPDRAGATKPDPEMLRLCLAAMGVSAAEALYVGDMVLDVDSAARAGIAVALVCGGSSPEADLRATGQRVLTRLDELLHLLPLTPPRPLMPPRAPVARCR